MGVSSADQPNVVHLDPQTQKIQRVTPTNAAVTVTPMRLIGGGFGSTNDSNAWTASNSGAGSASGVASNIATLGAGTTSGGYGILTSVTQARFLFASTNLFRGTFRVPTTGVANTLIQFGAFSLGTPPAISSGFYFQYDGTNLSLNCASGGSVTATVTNGSFNGDQSTFVMDTKAHNYEIMYQVANVLFFVDGILLHKFKPTTTLLSPVAALPINHVVQNTNTSTGATLEIWASNIIRYGAESSQPQYKNIAINTTSTIKLGPGHLFAIIINSPGLGGNTITVYDSTAGSGTKIATIANGNGTVPINVPYDCDFINGLTIVTASGTAGDVTIVYE